ncbi:hypothetical protein SLEP1_g11557 [Rubroshorea leprosula]|nr:hypothetical protein SLEP1_g11557 [Rubroshorea leprosula]
MITKKSEDADTPTIKKETMSQDADTTIKKEASIEGDLHPLYNEGKKEPEVRLFKRNTRREVYKPDAALSKSKDEWEKIQWDAVSTKIYCQVCAEEVNAGNDPSKIGWGDVAAKFNTRANGNYDKKQLICKWYELKNDWLLWKQLVGQETNLKWDHKSDKIIAGAQWWDEKIQENPEVAKFREGGLENLTEMNIMFSEVVPGGEKRCLRPRRLIIPTKQDVGGEGVIKLEETGDSNDVKVHLVSSKSQLARINKKRKKTTLDGQESNKKQVKKGKGKNVKVGIDTSGCCGAAVYTKSKLDHTCASVKGYHSQSSLTKISRKTDPPRCSILECMTLLRNLPGLEQGTELFMLGTRLFIKQDYREMFVSLQRADTQLAWLKQELERERANSKKQ